MNQIILFSIVGLIVVILIFFFIFRRRPSPKPQEELITIFSGLEKTRTKLTSGLESLLKGRASFDVDILPRLEELLFTSDLGVPTTEKLLNSLEENLPRMDKRDSSSIKLFLKNKIQEIFSGCKTTQPQSKKPLVILVLGVNGVGKTTTIAKLAKRYLDEGKSVLLAAGDTFRAAAVEQLQEWGKRLGVPVIHQQTGSDSSAVMFNALQTAIARNTDVVIADTAGRLHTKTPLMEELKKMDRVMKKVIPDAPHETLLVLDATTGQNAFQQVKQFQEALPISGLIMTKLDGTAKGGVLIGIVDQFHLPVRYIGIGEKMTDLQPFDPNKFTTALFD